MRFIAFFLLLLSSLAFSQTTDDYIPPQAFTYKETIKKELNNYFPNLPEYNYVPSLIEHESCISLSHKRCWQSTSELKTKRERGLGLGQVTIAYNSDGSVRFDTLTNLKNSYRNELKEASWSSIKYRPDLQIRMIALLLKSDYKNLYSITDPIERLKFTDSAYNGGIRDVHRSRLACGFAKSCDPQKWFGHTELYLAKSNKAIYGTRSARDINRNHVRDIFINRLPKYQSQYFTEKEA